MAWDIGDVFSDISSSVGSPEIKIDSKKIDKTTTTHAMFEQYEPVSVNLKQLQYSPQYLFGSGSSQSYTGELTAAASPAVSQSQTPDYSDSYTGASGTNLTNLALIGVVGLVAYGLIRR